MISSMKRRLRARRDDGAILIFAIIIVTTVAVVVGTILTRGDGSLRATVALRNAAGSAYSADAAANTALNDLRTGQWTGTATKPVGWGYDNEPFDGCFGRDKVDPLNTDPDAPTNPVNSLTLSNFYPAAGTQANPTSAYIVCTPENATGAQGTPVAINDNNKPGNAILTLGTCSTLALPACPVAEPGFTFKTNGSGGAFRVKGGIWSSSSIQRDSNGTLESTQYIKAKTGCSPLSAMSAPIVSCTGVTPPADPGYQNDLDVAGLGIPALQTVPSTCPTGTVTLNQGYYDDVTNLNLLTKNGGSGCFIHFNPGTYYFDFHNNSSDPLFDPDIAPSSSDVWTIASGTVVGGTPTSGTSIPGRCVSPIDDVNAQGVQFIMGGDSRIAVDHGAQVELCASYHGDRPPIAVYGQKTGNNPASTAPAATTISSTSPAPTMSPDGSWIHGTTGSVAPTAADIVANDANVASFKRSGGTSSASITESGFAPSTSIPKGAILTGASIKVGYTETVGSSASLTITPRNASGAGSAISGFTLPGTTPASQPYPADLSAISASNFGALQKYVHDNGLTGVSVGFTAGPKNNGDTTTLDSLNTLSLTYYLPNVRGETTSTIPSNTVATVGGSPVISAQGNNTLFYTQGTTYVPNASLYLALNNISESVFRFGVIARSLNIFETASFAFTGPVIELPDDSPGWGTKSTLVQLKVYLCPGSSTCSDTTGALALTTRAQIWDPTAVVNPPTREVNILSWSHTH